MLNDISMDILTVVRMLSGLWDHIHSLHIQLSHYYQASSFILQKYLDLNNVLKKQSSLHIIIARRSTSSSHRRRFISISLFFSDTF